MCTQAENVMQTTQETAHYSIALLCHQWVKSQLSDSTFKVQSVIQKQNDVRHQSLKHQQV